MPRAFRRTAQFLLINWHGGKSELRALDPPDLELALAQDQANAKTNVIKHSEAALSPSKDQKMTFPEWTKPGVYGALVGAVAVSILGFTWGGWTTSGGAQEMANSFAAEQVTLAMVPVCLNLSEADAERAEKLATLQEASSLQRRNAMMETGWATLPGTDAPSRDLANACLAGLELDGS